MTSIKEKLLPLKYILDTLTSLLIDFKRYTLLSSTFFTNSNRSQLQGLIIRQAHGLEVGMTYRPLRKDFGIGTANSLIDNLTRYTTRFGSDYIVESSIETLRRYHSVHTKLGSNTKDLETAIAKFVSKLIEVKTSPQTEPYVTFQSKDFHHFASGRRSCRLYLNHEISKSELEGIIETALSSPSACNRQPCKVYKVESSSTKSALLEIQNNRSKWREDANILVISAKLGYYNGPRERNAAYTDGGLFCMTLAYALCAKGYGTCMLNLNVKESMHSKMRRLLHSDEDEVFIMMIATGTPSPEATVPHKISRNVNDVLVIA